MVAVDPYEDDERPRRARSGKATVLTEDVHKRLVTARRTGATINDCCDYAGVLRDRHFEWMRRGRIYDEQITGDPETQRDDFEEIFRAYYLEFSRAGSEARVRANLTLVDLMAETQPPAVRFRASVFVLERTDAKNWGRRLALTGRDGGPVEFTDRTAEVARSIRNHVDQRRALEAEITDAEIVEETERDADDYDIWWSPDAATYWPDDL